MIVKSEIRELDTREIVRTVTSNDFITARGLDRLSLKGKKLLYIAIAQCRLTDKGFLTYEINTEQFAKLMNIKKSSVRHCTDEITDELLRSIIQIEDQSTGGFTKYSLFSMCKYSRGILTIKLNADMTPLLLELKGGFTQPLLNDFLMMKSKHSIAIWHLIQYKLHSKKPYNEQVLKFELTLKELRIITGTVDKLPQLSDFKARVFDRALKDIKEQCGVDITYTRILQSRKVVGFMCEAKSIHYLDYEALSEEDKKRIDTVKLKVKAKENLEKQKQQYYEEIEKDYKRMIKGQLKLDL